MMERKTAAIAGISTILMAGIAYLTWRKSINYRIKYLTNFADWKKEKIHNAYYDSLDERDFITG